MFGHWVVAVVIIVINIITISFKSPDAQTDNILSFCRFLFTRRRNVAYTWPAMDGGGERCFKVIKLALCLCSLSVVELKKTHVSTREFVHDYHQ